jgi:putative transposase
MEAGRRSLPHEIPVWVDISSSVFFITCCTIDRLEQSLLQPAIAQGLLDSIAHRVGKGGWWAHAVTIMPDHVHLVLSFPQEAVITKCIRDWKHWTAHRYGIRWQRDFFEHRLRNDESFEEKVDYVLQNPVRAGLAADWRDWAFTLIAQR